MNYDIIKTNRKTLAISVSKEQKIIVRAPKRITKKEVDNIVNNNIEWIKKQLEIMEERSENGILSRLGEDDILNLKKKAKNVIPDKVRYYSQIMGVNPLGIKITSAKTRWGSCSSKNSLCFSWRLMLLTDDVIDYIVVHELAHIRVKNHQIKFYEEVKKYMPDYKKRESKLKMLQKEL